MSRRRPSDFSSTSRISPSPVTMPLNMVRPAFVCFLAIGADRLAGNLFKLLIKQLSCARLQRRQTLFPDHCRRMEEYRLINEIGFDKSRRNGRAAFDHQACDAAFCEELKRLAQIEPTLFFRNAENFGAAL